MLYGVRLTNQNAYLKYFIINNNDNLMFTEKMVYYPSTNKVTVVFVPPSVRAQIPISNTIITFFF